MPASGLIAIEKVVERLGRAHKQRYWVKPSELREMVKKGDASGAVAKIGGNPERVQSLLKQWRTSSGSAGSASMRAAATKAVHATNPGMVQRELDRCTRAASGAHTVGEVGTGKSESRHVQDVTKAFQQGLEDDSVRKDLAALAAVSQSMYEQPKVTLWRGIRGNSTNAYLYEEAYDAVLKDPDAEIVLSTGVLSSFSEDYGVAQSFAKLSMASGEGSEGFYFKIEVPRDSIVMSHRAKGLNPGKPPEKEVTVLTNGSIRIKARDIVHAGDLPKQGLAKLAGKGSSKEEETVEKFAGRSAKEYRMKKYLTPAYKLSIEDYAAQYLGHKAKWK